ncbi:MAG: ABC transporter substrate-binding protein [Pseudomonadota bacterium]
MHQLVATASILAIGCALGSSAVWAQSEDRAVTIVTVEGLDIADPCNASRSNIGRVLKQNVVETFTEINPEDGAITPRLATSWEQTDPQTWRFQLREGVKFHDGEDFNAEAAKFSVERTLNENIPCEDRNKFFGGIELEVEVVDDYTIDVKSGKPEPILPTLMGALGVVSPNTPTDALTQEPIGTGPYVFAEWRPERDVVLERFDGYWGETPQVEKATYVWRDDSAVRAAMIETGEADIAPNIAVQDATNPETDYGYFNSETSRIRIMTEIPPLDDKRIREAINYAIDRDAFIGTILPAESVSAAQLVVPSITGHNHDIQPFPYDPAKAKELVEAARADGVAVDTPLRLVSRIGQWQNAVETMEAIQSMLTEVGLNVELQAVEVGQWADMANKPYAEDRPPTLLQSMHDNNAGDASFTIYFKYHSDGISSDIADAELDTLIEEAGVAVGEERDAAYQEIFRRLREDIVPDAMLYHMIGYSRVGPRVEFQPTLATNSELQLSQITFKE